MFKSLNQEGVKKIVDWLADHGVQTSAVRLHRDFSDCLKIAQTLKRIYPRIVDLNNYPKCSGVPLKVANWRTLNFKVLRKIGLSISEKRIASIAEAAPGAVDFLLYQLMLKDFESRLRHEEAVSAEEEFWTQNDDVLVANVRQWAQGEVVERPAKLILYSIYKEQLQALEESKRQIDFMQQQISHVENLKRLQEEHATEIRRRLAHKYGTSCGEGEEFEGCMVENVPSLDLTELVELPSVGSGSSETRSETLRCTVAETSLGSISKCTI